jgi:hypothetical protein
MQAIRNNPRIWQSCMGQNDQVAIVIRSPHQIASARLVAHQPRHSLLYGNTEIRAMQVCKLRQPVNLQDDHPHGDAMPTRASELILHQVQDLRLREQGTAQKSVGVGGLSAAPSRAAFPKAWSRHR